MKYINYSDKNSAQNHMGQDLNNIYIHFYRINDYLIPLM